MNQTEALHLTKECNLCGSTEHRLLYKITRFETPFTMYQCQDCNLVFMNPRPEDLNSFYQESYYSGDADYSYADERHDENREILNSARIKSLERFAPKGNLLDVGCSFGGLLKAAKDRGWTPYGLEISDYSRKTVEDLGFSVQGKDLVDAQFGANFFQAITMIELIEHLEDPTASLLKAGEFLADDGVLVIQTANYDSLKARFTRAEWEYFLPGHTFCFSRKTLTALLDKTGFKVEKVFLGDELGFKNKLTYGWRSADGPVFMKAKSAFNLGAKHLLRRIPLGPLTIGGHVFYAVKR